MKKRLLIIIFFLILQSFIVSNNIVGTNIKENEQENIIHFPISINGNRDFTSQNGVKEGSGTADDPFIISYLKIFPVTNEGISIKNVDAHFLIKNCTISGGKTFRKSGAYLNNVTNGTVENCTFYKNGFGICILNSSNNVVKDTCIHYAKTGLTINGCPKGRNAFSSNNTIKNCTFVSCDRDGIYFCCLPSSYNNLIESCHIKNNNRGICLDHCIHHTTIVGCNISQNHLGLEIVSVSESNQIFNNIFWNNDRDAYDNCNNTWDNGPIFGGNFWSKHNSYLPFTIPGAGKNIDKYPLENGIKSNFLDARFFHSPTLILTNQEILFDACLSYDSENNISKYYWDFGDGTSTEGPVVNHIFNSPGNHKVTLKIISGNRMDTISENINVFQISNNNYYVTEGSSIQDAIDNALPGETIHVGKGIYQENIVLDKPFISLYGEDYDNTIIFGKGIGNAIELSAPRINISGFTIITSSENKSGIQIGIPDYNLDCYGCEIKNNTISHCGNGISLIETEQNFISNNKILNNEKCGIYVVSSYHNEIFKNLVTGNDIGAKLKYGSNWNILSYNEFNNNEVGLILNWSHYNKITNNDISRNKKTGIFLDHPLSPKIKNNNICGNKLHGILIKIESENFSYFTYEFKNNWWGSIFGPSWLFPVFGDRIWTCGIELLKLRLFGVRNKSFPWLFKPSVVN